MEEMTNIIFLGGVFKEPLESEILKNTKYYSVQYAANKFQWHIIKGLLENNVRNLKVISAPFIGAYPMGYKKMKIKGHRYLFTKQHYIQSVAFNNLWGYRNISRTYSMRKKLRENLSLSHKETVLLVYSLHTPLILAAVKEKRKNPNIVICVVVPDLPQYMNLTNKKSVFYKILKKLDMTILKSIINEIDSFVLLTEEMRDILNIQAKPYCVVEGISEYGQEHSIINQKKEIEEHTDSYKRILYTGTLNEKYGVLNLVESFGKLDRSDTILQICGRGDSESLIKDLAENHKNIEFYGQVTNTKVTYLQKKADILVNPRQNNELFTKYSFPSKNIEYLLSGTPTIAYKLDGIPDEYDEYLFYPENNSLEALTRAISSLLSWSKEKRKTFGMRGREFVMEYKNPKASAKKILTTIEKSK